MHVLLVDGRLELGVNLQRYLFQNGFTSEWVRSANHATVLAEDHDIVGEAPYVCAVLNLKLPDICGIELIRRWRSRGITIPVLLHSEDDDATTRVEALEAGADDFVVGDSPLSEMVSRIRAVVRRSVGQSSSVWRAGELEIDTGKYEVRRRGRLLDLSRTEFALLLALARRRGQVVVRNTLIRAVSPLAEPMAYTALEWHVHNLRTKVGPSRIRTVRGVGYRLSDADIEAQCD